MQPDKRGNAAQGLRIVPTEAEIVSLRREIERLTAERDELSEALRDIGLMLAESRWTNAEKLQGVADVALRLGRVSPDA